MYNFNISDKNDLFEIYYKIRSNLQDEYKLFWDELLTLYDPITVYQSNLFRQENTFSIYSIINGNYYNTPYLKSEKDYNKLKLMIDNCVVNHYTGDIYKVDEFNSYYDLVNLSNIIDYTDYDIYKNHIEHYNLTKNGIVLSYIFLLEDEINEKFPSDKYTIKELSRKGVMIYNNRK